MTWHDNGKVYCSGTAGGYTSGCRCPDCTRAMTEMGRARRKRLRNDPDLDIGWMSRGACKGYPTRWWFAFPREDELAKAVGICAACPVKEQCAHYGKTMGEVGLWGGWYRQPDRVARHQISRPAMWRDLATGRDEKVSR